MSVHLPVWKLIKLNYIKRFNSQPCIRHESHPDGVQGSKWGSYVRNKCTQYALNPYPTNVENMVSS